MIQVAFPSGFLPSDDLPLSRFILPTSSFISCCNDAARRKTTMGLVDYSESESDSEVPAKPTPRPAAAGSSTGKKPFQKVVDRSNPGKIRVNLPQAQHGSSEASSEAPPAKRAKTSAGGGMFSGMNSFLPAPKNAGAKPPAQSGSARPAFQLRTSAEAGFSREDSGSSSGLPGQGGGSDLGLPAPKAPSIPEGMKSEEDVKLVGKPMMFRPLSVARNKKKPVKKSPAAATAASSAPKPEPSAGPATAPEAAAAPAPPKKISLFSLEAEPEADTEPTPSTAGTYEPLFETGNVAAAPLDAAYAQQAAAAPANTNSESLDSIADEMNLSAAARRELFGRSGVPGGPGGPNSATKVVNFNMDTEYRHNEELRAAGEEQIHNPVRGISGGKHSLRKLVSNVQNQREALEESFAKGKSNRKEASNRYGW